ncbi:MAG: pyrroline-5-carboxylate reductase [Lachnospiraceae bacterium]
MNRNIGFIGAGNMGKAMIKGFLSSGICTSDQLIVSDQNTIFLEELSNEFSIETTRDNKVTAQSANFLILAVKPQLYELVISEIRDVISNNTVIVSIAAGLKMAQIVTWFQRPVKLIRIMPNTPAMVLEAMSAIVPGSDVTEDELCYVLQLFQSIGRAEVVSESLMDTVTGVSGSSPAYVYLFIEAMADAAVADGMPRDKAYTFAAQSVLGAAKMVLATGQHPGQLKDAVCSPGGTTIEAVTILEEKGLRSAVICAQRACVNKSRDLGK